MAAYLEKKYGEIKKEFQNDVIFTVNDVMKLFPEITNSSIYWYLSKLASNGYLLRVGKGKYTLNLNKSDDKPIMSSAARKILDILAETGFDYYVSGIDVLAKYLHHIPENYPIMLFVNKFSIDEVIDMLAIHKITAVVAKTILNNELLIKLNVINDIVVVYATESFVYAKNHIAEMEKAFIDLYFEISRNKFPFAIQELARVYDNMLRKGAIDNSKLIKTAYVRSIQSEIRFLVDGKNMPDEAFVFVNTLRVISKNG